MSTFPSAFPKAVAVSKYWHFQYIEWIVIVVKQTNTRITLLNRDDTDLKPTKIIEFGKRLVWSRSWFGFVGLGSVCVRAVKFVVERSFKQRSHLNQLSVSCRYCVGVGRSGTCCGEFGHRWHMSILDRSCIRHFLADLISTQDRQGLDTPRTQSECKTTIVCDVIPAYKSTSNAGYTSCGLDFVGLT